MSKRNILRQSIASLCALSCVTFAQAEDVEVVRDTTVELETITVTATKREASLQSVPVVISVVSGEKITEFNMTNFEDIEVPGFQAPRGGMGDQIFIRGVGSGPNLGFEQSVPIFMDGVYFGRSRGTRAGFVDLERVEVLKGPQPTYAGKNAIAGAVLLNWAKPTEEFEGYVDALYEFNHNEWSTTGVLSGPITDGLRARVAVRYRDLSEGWVQNIATEQSEPRSENFTGRAIFEFDATDDVLVTVAGWYSRDEELGRNQELSVCSSNPGFIARNMNPTDDCVVNGIRSAVNDPIRPVTGYLTDGTPGSLVSLPDNSSLNADPAGYGLLELYGAYGRVEAEIGDGISFFSQTSYYEFDNQFYADADQTATLLAGPGFNEYFNQFSQEIRIQSNSEDSLNWMVGAYYDNNDVGFLNVNPVINMGMGNTLVRDFEEEAKSWAVFAEVGYSFTEELELILAGRYTKVDKNIDVQGCRGQELAEGETVVNCAAPGPGARIPFSQTSSSASFEKFQPSVTLNWFPTEDILLFVSWKQGFKAGGFDFGAEPNVTPDLLGFDQEEVSAWEVGMKSTLFDNAATFNLTYFRGKYDDLQVTAFNPVTDLSNTNNAASSISQGVEAELSWAITEGLTFNATAIYLNSEYDDYPGAPCAVGAGPSTGFPECDLSSDNGRLQNLAGQPLAYAPDFTGQFSLNYNRPITEDLEIDTRLEIFTVDNFFTAPDLDPASLQEAYTTIDFRLALGAIDEAWQVAFIGRNLTDELVCSFRGDVPASAFVTDPVTGVAEGTHTCILDRTRTFAVQARFRF